MDSESQLAALYSVAVAEFEQLHSEKRITTKELEILKGHATLRDVINVIYRETENRKSSDAPALKLFGKLSTGFAESVDRYCGVVETLVQAGTSSSRHCLIGRIAHFLSYIAPGIASLVGVR